MKAQLHIAHILDLGKSRSVQQDQLICGYIDDNRNWKFDVHGSLETDTSLAVLSDGMGGAVSGDVASGLVIKVIKEYISDHFPEDGLGDNKELLLKAVDQANKAIDQHVIDHPKDLNMGATVVVCLLTDDLAHIVWVGDSRCYKLSGDKFKQLTKDHSLVQQLVDSGEIQEHQAMYHPKKNIITQSLSGRSYKPDYVSTNLKKGDTLVICSDGLNGMISDEDIKHELLNLSPERAIKQLVKKANEAGGLDNISIILQKRPLNLSYIPPIDSGKKSSVGKSKQKNQVWILGLLLFLMSIVFIAMNIWPKPKGSVIESNLNISVKDSNPEVIVSHSNPEANQETVMPEVTEEIASNQQYPESGPGNQRFYIRLGTFSDAQIANDYQSEILKVLPNEDDLLIANTDTFFELKTRFFSSRSQANTYLSKYLSNREGIIINASND